MTELSKADGPSCESYDTVRRWMNTFGPGIESIKMRQNQVGHTLHLVEKLIQNNVIIEGDARITVHDIVP